MPADSRERKQFWFVFDTGREKCWESTGEHFYLLSFQTPGCHNGPKYLKTCFEVLETSFEEKICTYFPKICTNRPQRCTNCPNIFTNFSKKKNSVTRFLNNFRIYGTPPHRGFTMILNFYTAEEGYICFVDVSGHGLRVLRMSLALEQPQGSSGASLGLL